MTENLNTKNWKRGRLIFLIIDSNNKNRSIICRYITTYYNCLEAKNVNESLAILDKYRVDFIISSISKTKISNLIEVNNWDVNSLFAYIPFLLITKPNSYVNHTGTYFTDPYIEEPIKEGVLLNKVNEIFRRRKLARLKYENFIKSNSIEEIEEEKNKEFVSLALDIMKKNYQAPNFTVNDFAKRMGLSKSSLNRKLNQITNASSSQFIRNYRLNIAYKLLLNNKREENKSISEIAYYVGFNDPKYFTRCFSKQFNITPSDLIKE